MNKKNPNKILIIMVIVLAIIVVVLAAIIIGHSVGIKQTKEGYTEENHIDKESITNIETASEIDNVKIQETVTEKTTEQVSIDSIEITEAEYGVGMYLTEGATVDNILYEDGGMMLNLKSVNDGLVSFEITTIQAAPASRIADIQIDDLQLDENGVGKFKFDDDGWGNRGNGTIAFKGNNRIKISIKITKRDSEAMWNIGEGTKEYGYREDQKVADLW